MKRSARRTTGQVAGVVALMAVLFAWNEGFFRDRIRAEPPVAGAAKPFDGENAVAERRTIPVVVEVAGGVHARRSAALSARVAGVIEAVLVDEGDRVAAGDVVVRLVAPDLHSRGDAARGAVAATRAAFEQAESDFRRVERLHRREAATALELERATTRRREASAGLSRALGESEATSAVAGYAHLEAPFDGVVVRRSMDPGDLAAPTVPVLVIIDDGGFHVETDVAEGIAARLEVGREVEIGIDALGESRSGRIDEIVPASDPATRTTRIKVSLDDLEGLRAGLFVRARLRIGEREAIVVPARALRRVGELTLVDAIAADGSLEPRFVELGGKLEGGASIEVTTGVAAGERVALGR